MSNTEFDAVVGTTTTTLDDIGEAGCFFTTALKERLQVDVSIQNLGGLRSQIYQGEITKFKIYQLYPFNSQSVIYHVTVGELKTFLIETSLAIAFTGMSITRSGDEIVISDSSGNLIDDTASITLGMNSFIPALYEDYFPFDDADIKDFTTAEALVDYLIDDQNTINFEDRNRLFAYE